MKPHTATEQGPLLKQLYNLFPDQTKTRIKQLLKHGSVRVNKKTVTAHDYPLKKGDEIDFLSKETAWSEKLKNSLSFPIVYEDEDILVIDKPSGLLTMGTEKDKINTAYFELTDYVRSHDKKGRGRIFIVHRLDREASGLVVFAKNALAKKMLQEKWNDAVKKYYAVVEGSPAKSEGRIESYLAEDSFRRVFSTSARSRDAKHAVTLYRVLERKQGYSLLDVTLVTGRKNQIRVHLSDLGCPIAGDKKYGSRNNPLGRLGLHAYFLSFAHPKDGRIKTFKTELPKDF